MLRLSPIMLTAALLLTADFPGITQLRPTSKQPVEFSTADNLPILPDLTPAKTAASGSPVAGAQEGQSVPTAPAASAARLTDDSRLALVRYVEFEFVKALIPLPGGKDGFHLKAGQVPDRMQLQKALTFGGAAVNAGDTAQITSLDFKDKSIVVDINGGGRGKQKLRDRVHMEVGGIPSIQVTDPTKSVTPKVGATLVLDFDRDLPDMTPAELKSYLATMLDFTDPHSAAVQWIDTLPPDIQKAIKDGRAVVGMNHEMVMSAVGRPDRKVRERDNDGNETEDWIYGAPPAKTVFVTFEGDKVVKVEQFPN